MTKDKSPRSKENLIWHVIIVCEVFMLYLIPFPTAIPAPFMFQLATKSVKYDHAIIFFSINFSCP